MQTEIAIFDNFISDEPVYQYWDTRYKLSFKDVTIYDITSDTHSRLDFQYCQWKIKKPTGQVVTYGNFGTCDKPWLPASLLPEDIEIESPVIGIYEATLYQVPLAITGEIYYANECVYFNAKIYKFSGTTTFAGAVHANMSEIELTDVTGRYTATMEFYSVTAVIACVSKKLESLFCKLKTDPTYNVCEDKEYQDVMIALSLGLSELPIGTTITDLNRSKYKDIFNYLSQACNCPTC